MMEIKKTLKAPNSFVFERMVASGLYDVKRATGRELAASQLSGFEYSKNFGKAQAGRVRFDEVVAPSVYAFSTFTNRNTFHTRWSLSPVDAGATAVTIVERNESVGFVQMLNDKLVGLLLGRAKRRQMVAILESIEAAYRAGD